MTLSPDELAEKIAAIERGDRFEVADTQKRPVQGRDGSVTTHLGRVTRGVIRRGDRVRLEIDRERRDAAARPAGRTPSQRRPR